MTRARGTTGTGQGRRPRARRRALLAVLVASLAVVVAACGPPVASGASCGAPGGPPDATTARVFALVNQARANNGVRQLSWDPQLYCLAAGWSAHLGSTGGFYHRDLGAALNTAEYSGYRTLGENILRGPSSMTGDAMFNAWMGSPSHAANILSNAFSTSAVALYFTPGGMVYATQNFGG